MRNNAEIAQLVEHFPEEEGVAGSSPALGTRSTSLSASTLVRFYLKLRLAPLIEFW